MARILNEGSMEALLTSRAVRYSDCGSSCSDVMSVNSGIRDYSESSTNSSASSPLMLNRSASTGAISLYSTPRRSNRSRSRKTSLIMEDNDKAIYNSLGSSSSPCGKLTYSQLGLQRGWKKRGLISKTGPNPSWLCKWKRRLFILKGNFLYYFAPCRNLNDAPVLGAIYLKNAIIKKESMALAKRVIKISPPVPRRMGSKSADDESSVFYIKFRTESGRDEWYEELQQVSFDNEFPTEKEALINTSFSFTARSRSYTGTRY